VELVAFCVISRSWVKAVRKNRTLDPQTPGKFCAQMLEKEILDIPDRKQLNRVH